jgi:hypothetical protein
MRVINENTFPQEEQVKQILTYVKFLDTKIGDLIKEEKHQIKQNNEADFNLKVSKYLLEKLSNCITNYEKIKK